MAEEAKSNQVEEIETVYVGAITLNLSGHLYEVIVFGMKDGMLQSSVEHDPGALPNLVDMCEALVGIGHTMDGIPVVGYRILKFEGPTKLDPDEFRGYDSFCFRSSRKSS